MKVITIVGSLKFKEEIVDFANKLILEGNCVLIPFFFACDINNEMMINLKKAHLKKISLSDEVFVINKDNYIGESTKLEIEYAKGLGKKVLYYTDFIK